MTRHWSHHIDPMHALRGAVIVLLAIVFGAMAAWIGWVLY